ncbi:MAG: hypothetical protein V2I33_19660 [Kangiellaceae bacterium]|nr:hypothetical protein [Kangiellaceae bacterium]
MSDASDKPCTAQAIQLLNETKEYRLIATCAMRQVLEDPKLSDAAVRGWMTLYCYSARNIRIAMVVSTRRLGQILGRSESSARRILKELQQKGYLEVKERKSKEGIQGANEFRPRLPDQSAKRLIDETPDRDRAHVKVQMKLEENNKQDRVGQGDEEAIESYHSPDARLFATLLAFESRANTVNLANIETKDEEPETNINGRLHQRDSQSVSIKSLYKTALKQKDTSESVSERFEKMRQAAKEEATREAIKRKRASVRTERGGGSKSDSHYSTKDSLKTNSFVDVNFLMKRAKRQLAGLGFGESQSQDLINQIHFAIRQGTFKDHEPAHGLNICLKLIRQNTWRTPIGFVAA